MVAYLAWHTIVLRSLMKGFAMRITGLVLIVLGVLALLIRSVTFFTTETRVGPLGMFAWDVAQPHTLFIHPLLGILAVVAGIVLMTTNRRHLVAR